MTTQATCEELTVWNKGHCLQVRPKEKGLWGVPCAAEKGQKVAYVAMEKHGEHVLLVEIRTEEK